LPAHRSWCSRVRVLVLLGGGCPCPIHLVPPARKLAGDGSPFTRPPVPASILTGCLVPVRGGLCAPKKQRRVLRAELDGPPVAVGIRVQAFLSANRWPSGGDSAQPTAATPNPKRASSIFAPQLVAPAGRPGQGLWRRALASCSVPVSVLLPLRPGEFTPRRRRPRRTLRGSVGPVFARFHGVARDHRGTGAALAPVTRWLPIDTGQPPVDPPATLLEPFIPGSSGRLRTSAHPHLAGLLLVSHRSSLSSRLGPDAHFRCYLPSWMSPRGHDPRVRLADNGSLPLPLAR